MAEPLEIVPPERPEGGPRKPFLEHLEDLRRALLKCVTVIAVAVVVCLLLDKQLAGILEYPIRRINMLEGRRPTVSFLIGGTRLGPYTVTRDQFPGLPPGAAPHVVYRIGLAKIGGEQVATLQPDPTAEADAIPVKLRNFNPAEGFTVAFHLALYGGLVISARFGCISWGSSSSRRSISAKRNSSSPGWGGACSCSRSASC